MKDLRLFAVLMVLTLVSAACGAAFAVSGEQTAEPIGASDAMADGDDASTDESATSGDAEGDADVDDTGAESTDTADPDADADAAAADDTSTTEPAETTISDAALGVVLNSADAFDGQVLFGPAQGASQYLVANNGDVAATWTRFGPGVPNSDAELLPNGLILRSSPNASIDAIGATGRIELVDSSGAVAWSCTLNEAWFGGQHFHGDAMWIAPDPVRGTEPWGSLLMSAYLIQSGDQLGTIGKNLTAADRVYVDSLIEVVPNVIDDSLADEGGSYRRSECGTTVWEWRATDRIQFDAADLPVPGGRDWTTFTSIDYSPEFDMVAAASPSLGEVWIIDHATDTEASRTDSVNAELLARFDGADEPVSVSWAGGLLLVVADGAVWSVDTSSNNAEVLYELSGTAGYAEQLPNGNLLITDSDVGRIIELGPTGESVWEFVSPVINDGTGTSPDEVLDLDAEVPPGQNRIARAHKYASDYPGFD